MNKHVVQLIRERFHPLVRFCGPQSAGEGLCSWSLGEVWWDTTLRYLERLALGQPPWPASR
jgi:hypothetical protein